MTPRNRKRCHSRATAKGRYPSAPLGIPLSTNLAPAPGWSWTVQNFLQDFWRFFPKTRIDSINLLTYSKKRDWYHTSPQTMTLWTIMNSIEAHFPWDLAFFPHSILKPGGCLEAARGREGKMRSLGPVLAGGVEHHGQQTPGRKRKMLKNLKIIWDNMRCTNCLLQHHCHSMFNKILNHSESWSIIFNTHSGCETALLCCQVTMLHSSDIVWRDPQSCHATFQLRLMCFGI